MSLPADREPGERLVTRYEMFRSQIEHEDELVYHRSSWLFAAQAFMFGAYAVVLQALAGAGEPVGSHDAARYQREILVALRDLRSLIPLVGAFTCLLVWFSICCALLQIENLVHEFYYGRRPVGDSFDVRVWFDRVLGHEACADEYAAFPPEGLPGDARGRGPLAPPAPLAHPLRLVASTLAARRRVDLRGRPGPCGRLGLRRRRYPDHRPAGRGPGGPAAGPDRPEG